MKNLDEKKCAFTICSKNYLGLAFALRESFLEKNTDTDFFIFIADEYENGVELAKFDSEKILSAKNVLNIDDKVWRQMSFIYDVTEFCTSIKPDAFIYLFKKEYEKVIYLDPDIMVANSLDFIYEDLNDYKVILTPHEINPHLMSKDNILDNQALRSGIANLGFAGFRNTPETLDVLKWWGNKLRYYAVTELPSGLFTDQKWTDFFPSLLSAGDVYYSKHIGMNFAPWNYYQRYVLKENNTYYVYSEKIGKEVIKDKLIFFHASGYNYATLSTNPMHTKTNYKQKGDIISLLNDYGKILDKTQFTKYLKLGYSYNTYNNNKAISYIHRRIYRRLLLEGKDTGNPFYEDSLFYKMIKKKGFISNKTNKVEKIKAVNYAWESKTKKIDKMVNWARKFFPNHWYVLFCRFSIRYFKFDNQARLLDKKFNKMKIR